MIINDTIFNCSLNEVLDELKRQLTINKIPYLHTIKDSGENIQVSCPYHKGGQEKRPSAGIRKSDGTFHCFTCGEIHSLPEVISHCFGYNDILGKQGWNWLLKNFLTVSVEERKDVTLDFSRGRNSDNNSKSYIPEDELDKYRYIHPYMYKRKLTDEVIERFDVGYDKYNNCITFPVKDIRGNCLFLATRSVETKYFHYPSGVDKPVYGIYELYSLDSFPSEVYICESMIDALTLWTHNKYAVALNGLGTELQFKQLNDMPCRKFILATDSDEAGMRARDRISKHLKNKLLTQIIFPAGRKDVNECTWEEIENLEEVFI